jgi:probable phosphoglycerate mutase
MRSSSATTGTRSPRFAPHAVEIVLVRHGETEWSRSGRHTGRTDVLLTERGRSEARIVGRALRGRHFAQVLTSPLQRAAETCRLAGFEGSPCRALEEWDYGEYEGQTTPEIRKARPGWFLWRDDVPGGETAEDVGGRTDRVIEEVRTAEGDVVVFAHGHVLRVLTARWLGLDARAGRLFALDPATISILGYEHGTRVIRLWNETPAPESGRS